MSKQKFFPEKIETNLTDFQFVVSTLKKIYICDLHICYTNIEENENICFNVVEKFSKIKFLINIKIQDVFNENMFLNSNSFPLKSNENAFFYKKNLYFIFLILKNCFTCENNQYNENAQRTIHNFYFFKIIQKDYAYNNLNEEDIQVLLNLNFLEKASSFLEADMLVLLLTYKNNEHQHKFLFNLNKI